MKTLDCRGLACPQPVLETKKLLEGSLEGEITVLVDNLGSRENVRRFAENEGYEVNGSEEKGIFTLRIQKKGPLFPEKKALEKPAQRGGDWILYLDSDSLGRGPEELGQILLRSFMHTLKEASAKPPKMILINSGVKLACEGSQVLEDLNNIAIQGVEILSCGTCLDYFGLKTKLRVGRITNMYGILESLGQADKVVRL